MSCDIQQSLSIEPGTAASAEYKRSLPVAQTPLWPATCGTILN